MAFHCMQNHAENYLATTATRIRHDVDGNDGWDNDSSENEDHLPERYLYRALTVEGMWMFTLWKHTAGFHVMNKDM